MDGHAEAGFANFDVVELVNRIPGHIPGERAVIVGGWDRTFLIDFQATADSVKPWRAERGPTSAMRRVQP
jgi:hypothetical protein